jgi:hypothetical protein
MCYRVFFIANFALRVSNLPLHLNRGYYPRYFYAHLRV